MTIIFLTQLNDFKLTPPPHIMIKLHNSNKKISVGLTENLKSQFGGTLKLYLTGCSFSKLAVLIKKN